MEGTGVVSDAPSPRVAPSQPPSDAHQAGRTPGTEQLAAGMRRHGLLAPLPATTPAATASTDRSTPAEGRGGNRRSMGQGDPGHADNARSVRRRNRNRNRGPRPRGGLRAMSTSDLKRLCREKGLPVGGSRADVRKRLEAAVVVAAQSNATLPTQGRSNLKLARTATRLASSYRFVPAVSDEAAAEQEAKAVIAASLRLTRQGAAGHGGEDDSELRALIDGNVSGDDSDGATGSVLDGGHGATMRAIATSRPHKATFADAVMAAAPGVVEDEADGRARLATIVDSTSRARLLAAAKHRARAMQRSGDVVSAHQLLVLTEASKPREVATEPTPRPRGLRRGSGRGYMRQREEKPGVRGSDGRRVPGFCDTNAAKRVWVALMCTLAALTSLLMAYFIMFPVRGQLLPDDARLLKFAYSDPGSGGSVLQLDFEVPVLVENRNVFSEAEMTHAEASVAYRGIPLLWGQVNLTYVPASSVAKLRIVTHVIDFHLASPVMLLTIQDRCSNDTFPEFRQWLALQHESRSSPLSGVTLPEFGAPNAPPRPNITVTAEVVVRFGTTMVLQPDDSFPRFPATQGEAAAVHFTLGETTVLCPDYTIPPYHDASRRR